jgi:choice-of-anchor A domain-containing protein
MLILLGNILTRIIVITLRSVVLKYNCSLIKYPLNFVRLILIGFHLRNNKNVQISKFSIAGMLLVGLSQVANAGSVEVDAISLLNQYNLITSGNVTSSSHVDGNALIGGNVSGGTYNMHSTSNAVVPTLTVGGNTSGYIQTKGKGVNVAGNVAGNININDGGDAYFGSVSGTVQNNANGNGSTSVVGNISGSVNTNGGNTIYGGTVTGYAGANGSGHVLNQTVTTPFDPAATAVNAINTLSQFSDNLSGLDSNSNYSINYGKVTFNANADTNGLAIFTIDNAKSFFDSAYEFAFNVGTATSILFNVFSDGNTDLNLHANFLGGSASNLGSILLWNFVDATSLNVAAQFGGSVLALNADVTTNQNIEGTLVAKNLNQFAEIHSQPSDFVAPNITVPVSAVPIPAAALLFAPALLGFMGFRRKLRV